MTVNPELTKETDFLSGVVLVIDKPLEWTSTDVVRKIKAMLRGIGHKKIKIGHAGTLDPLATGILIVCIGKATKMVEKLQSETKEYEAEITLGATTPSFDMEHPIDTRYPWEHITREAVGEALQRLCGERMQTPPVYSAKMIDGRRAYDYARAGQEVKMREALVNIYSMELLECELPVIKVRITCSKGTYIRSIAKELGEELGSGAYLSALRRTKSGDFTVEKSLPMEKIVNSFSSLKQN